MGDKQLKLFRGNWDGKHERAVVCATKTGAMELLGATRSHMDAMFSNPSTFFRDDDKVVWASPGTVFQRKMHYGSDRREWKSLAEYSESLEAPTQDEALDSGAPVSTIDASAAVMALAAAAMLAELKESRWYMSAPEHLRAVDPVITIAGVEHREVFTTVGGGIGGSASSAKPFLIGHVEVGGIRAKLALRIDFGIGGFLVFEGE